MEGFAIGVIIGFLFCWVVPNTSATNEHIRIALEKCEANDGLRKVRPYLLTRSKAFCNNGATFMFEIKEEQQ